MKKFQNYSKNILKLFTICIVFISSSCKDANKETATTETTSTTIEVPKQDIHEAILKNNFDVLKQHIEAKKDINKKEAMGGSTPLMTAITFNKIEMVKALINADADLSIKNNDGSTALHTAAFFGKVEMVQLLLDNNADKSIKNNFGATPRETVLGDFSQIKPIYDMMILQLQPMGFQLDLKQVEKVRPVIALMLQ